MNDMKFWKLIPIILLVVLSSCKDTLTVDLDNRTVADGYYDSSQKIEQAVVGGYVDLRRALLANYAFLMYGDARTGDLTVAVDFQPTVASQNLTAPNRYLQQVTDWGYFYDVIKDANDVLDIVGKANGDILNNYQRNLFKGEALALKSTAYFYLARIWGTIPSAEKNDFGKLLNNEEAVTLAAGFATQAKALLPWLLINDDGIESLSLTNIRFNRTAITSLLAHEELWLGRAQNAYDLLTNTFTAATADSVSTFGLSLGEDRRTEIPEYPLAADVVSISLTRLNAIYPTGDARRAAKFNINTDANRATFVDRNLDMLELLPVSEVDLLFAEAAFRSGKLDEAKTHLIEAATGATEDYATLTEATFADALLIERRRILIGTGQRVFDLIRFGKVPTYITQFTEADVQNGAAWWPLSASSMKGNSLSQNSYWLSKN